MNSAIDLSISPYFNLEERNICHSIAASSAKLSTISPGDGLGITLLIVVTLVALNTEPGVTDLYLIWPSKLQKLVFLTLAWLVR